MVRLNVVVVLLCFGWIASGCGVVRHSAQPVGESAPLPKATPERNPAPADSGDSASPRTSAPGSSGPQPAMAVTSIDEVQTNLMAAYEKWEGTPYRLGGSSRSGVDCSQFMNIVFEEYFGVELPHTTRTQLNVGKSIRRPAIRTGDLIFFRTGPKTLHVGVAVNSGEFLHASTSNGVMISKFGNSYWRSRYLEARRVL